MSSLADLNDRARMIFKEIVEGFLLTGDPMGSRTISELGHVDLSPATVRNVMADLEAIGLIKAPHTSAGRIPTDQGLRFFVDGMMQRGQLTREERDAIHSQAAAAELPLDQKLAEASRVLSGLSSCASLVFVPRRDVVVQHLEFVPLNNAQALVVLVGSDGSVDNRLVNLPAGLPPSALVQAGNYLSARLAGRRIDDMKAFIEEDLANQQAELDALTSALVEAGVAVWSGSGDQDPGALIVSGVSNLLESISAEQDLEQVRHLFDELERKKDLIKLLDLARSGDGVRLFIGAENKLFSLSGSSLIAAPYMNAAHQMVGVVGVIGPTRLNYARIIPMVDYTAQVVTRLLSGER